MISIPNYMQTTASTIYGDMAPMDKIAFDVSIDPASVIGAIAGGYTANRVFQNKQQEHNENMQAQQRIENDYYDQVNRVMADLKIVFTPINVIFKVNNQVFEIIKTNEMTPHMRRAFEQKDGDYFRNILVKKMNMEMQMAEQAFTKRLLQRNQQIKEASYMTKQDYLTKTSEEDFGMMKEASDQFVSKLGPLKIDVSFDSLRPFDHSAIFFNENELDKVAGVFDYFRRDPNESFSASDLRSQVQIGFLPDRVIFLHDGQLLEQLNLLNMNEEGYEAFRKKNKEFFREFFYNEMEEAENASPVSAEEQLPKEAAEEDDLPAEEENEEEEPQEDLEEIIEAHPVPLVAREELNVFRDGDVHPLVYESVLREKYGKTWTRLELEAIFKQLEEDFNIEKGLGDNAINKIGMIHAMAGEDQTIFMTSFTFDKFLRAMNDKKINFGQYERNVDNNEIFFAIDIAKSYKGDHLFVEFNDSLTDYLAEEFFQNDLRFVSDVLYEEDISQERDFFARVNGLLQRKWKEEDAKGIEDDKERKRRQRSTERINEVSRRITQEYAEYIDLDRVKQSLNDLFDQEGFIEEGLEDYEPMKRAIIDTVDANVTAALYIEIRREELKMLLARIEKEGVK